MMSKEKENKYKVDAIYVELGNINRPSKSTGPKNFDQLARSIDSLYSKENSPKGVQYGMAEKRNKGNYSRWSHLFMALLRPLPLVQR